MFKIPYVYIHAQVYHKGFTQFHITGTVSPYVSVAVFNPEAGGKPARVALYRFTPSSDSTGTTNVTGPVSSRTIFAASEAKLMWNSTGSALLVYAHSDTDASSYYGATGLFLLQAHSDNAIKVYVLMRVCAHVWAQRNSAVVVIVCSLESCFCFYYCCRWSRARTGPCTTCSGPQLATGINIVMNIRVSIVSLSVRIFSTNINTIS